MLKRLTFDYTLNKLADKILMNLTKKNYSLITGFDNKKYYSKSYSWFSIDDLLMMFHKHRLEQILYTIDTLKANGHIDVLDANNKYEIRVKALPKGERAYDEGQYLEKYLSFLIRKIVGLIKASPKLEVNNTQNNNF